MEHYETIIGGGPVGGSCAQALKKEVREVLILDKKEFPRLKLCAGWITPQILRDLEVFINRRFGRHGHRRPRRGYWSGRRKRDNRREVNYGPGQLRIIENQKFRSTNKLFRWVAGKVLI